MIENDFAFVTKPEVDCERVKLRAEINIKGSFHRAEINIKGSFHPLSVKVSEIIDEDQNEFSALAWDP